MVELIMVIVIMGVVGGMVSVFMRGPIDAYISAGRRAALTDTADTTVRRIARDLHKALPNSLRPCVNGLEFIPTKTGGRYRTEGTGALNFAGAATSFNMFGDNATFAGGALPAEQQIAAGDLIVVYNLGITGVDAYANNNVATVSSLGAVTGNETPIFIGAKQFPLASASNRFHVVPAAEQMVSYVCDTNTRTLYRTASAALTAAPSCPITGAKIATNVDCANTGFNISDSGNALNRNALVSMRLTLQDSSITESVTLQHEVHVDNTP
jgi:MSHA biogenesis protein MshO